MKQKLRFIITFALTLINSAFSEKLGDFIKSKSCDKAPVQEILSKQINQIAISLSGQTLKSYEDLSRTYQNPQYVTYGFMADQKTYDSFSNIRKQGAGTIQFTRSFLSLPQFYIINEMKKKDNMCVPSMYDQDIGSNYSDCKLCSGKYFSINYEYLSLNTQLQFTAIIDNNTYLWRFHDDETKTQEYMVEAFQTLWNCNNPDDSIKITKIFDESTKNKLKISSLSGFDKICKSCQDSACMECKSDYTTCLSCADGFIVVNNKCIKCPIQNCTQCSYNNSNQQICQACEQGFYFYNNNCVKQCPPETYTGKSACIICKVGEYFNGESCSNCSNYCKKCSGPSGEECSECYFGFIQQNNQCVVCKDNSKCPDGVCKSNQYRSLQYPFNCELCDDKCLTCSNSGPMSCLSCKEGLRIVGGRCTDIFYKPSTYIDPKTGKQKQCNFSCAECSDSTTCCKECNPDLNYYVKDGDRKICYTKCPTNYVTNDSDLSKEFYECKLSDTYTQDQKDADRILQEAQKRCSDYTFWDAVSSTCKKCVKRCLSCTSKDSCSECAPGYYWDEQSLMCLACHNSCKKCTGPLYSQCILCKDVTKMYPNKQGICDVTAQSQVPTQTKVPTSLEIFGDLKTCKTSYNDKLNQIYAVKLSQTFSTQDDSWKDIELISEGKECKFDDFKDSYSTLKSSYENCDDISISKMSTKGQMTVIYAILLSQSGVKLEGSDINPGSLADYAKKESKYATYNIYKPRGKFSCDRLTCESSLDNYMKGFDRGRNQIVSIKSTDEIVLTSNGKQINCHDSSIPIYDEQPLKELEQTVSQARISVNTNSKVYFLVDVCVTGSDGKQGKKTFLATDFFEKGFIRALDVDSESEDEKYNIFFVQGASQSQNEYLKKCNPQYKNKFTSYLVSRIKKVEVEHENVEVNQAEEQANQITEKNNPKETEEQPKACTCITAKDYILQNEGKGGELQKVVSPQDTFFTKSIKVSNVADILKANKLDPVKMKEDKISVSSVQASKIFDQYLEKITTSTYSCYGLTTSSNQCIQNVLIDIVFSNNGQCINSSELKTAVTKNDNASLIKTIQNSSYCTSQQERCNKHIQILRGCK